MSVISVDFREDILDFDLINKKIKDESMSKDDKILARWYQTNSVARTIYHLKSGYKRICIVLPTGAGKTHTSRMLFKSKELRKFLGVKNRPLKLLFVTHKQRLATQAFRTYDSENNIEFISQSAFSPISEELIEEGWDITCVDEAHHEAMHSFQILLDSIKERPIIGLTATPQRSDCLLLKFEKLVCEISRKQAVEEGFLAKTFLNSIIDTGGKNKLDLMKRVLDNYAQEMGQTIIFVRTKKEVEKLTEYLINNGYKSIALLNQTDNEVDNILDEFSDGKYQFVLNCQKINEGVDVKNCNTVVLGRQYGSQNEINQAIGRAARPDSDCNVWQLINPLRKNLDTTEIVGKPETHRLICFKNGIPQERFFGKNSCITKAA